MNFFLPGLKRARKWRETSPWKKRYEPARMAYQRLMDQGGAVPGARRQTRERYESLDLFALKTELERRLQLILVGRRESPPRPAGGCAPPATGLTSALYS